MTFKIFDSSCIGRKRKEVVIIGSDSIYFNPALSRSRLDKILYAELYFDEETNEIGIKPLRDKTEKCLTIRGKVTRRVWARQFMELYRCVHKERKSYSPVWDESLKMIRVKL